MQQSDVSSCFYRCKLTNRKTEIAAPAADAVFLQRRRVLIWDWPQIEYNMQTQALLLSHTHVCMQIKSGRIQPIILLPTKWQPCWRTSTHVPRAHQKFVRHGGYLSEIMGVTKRISMGPSVHVFVHLSCPVDQMPLTGFCSRFREKPIPEVCSKFSKLQSLMSKLSFLRLYSSNWLS